MKNTILQKKEVTFVLVGQQDEQLFCKFVLKFDEEKTTKKKISQNSIENIFILQVV